jgi:hypothetical protein
VLAAETLAPPSDGIIVVARIDDASLVLATVRTEQVGWVLSRSAKGSLVDPARGRFATLHPYM